MNLRNSLQKFTSPSWREGGMLAAFAVLGGLMSLLSGQDVSPEPFRHNLYPAYALLSGRMGIDVVAAGAGPAVSPLLFIPYYLVFVKLNAWPMLSLFLRGLPYGLLMFWVWKIAKAVFRTDGEKFFRWMVTVLAVTGYAAVSQIGRGNGSLWLAVLGVWACYLCFCSQRKNAVAAAFFVASFGAGLDISALPVVAGLAVSLPLVRPKEKSGWLKILGCTVLGFLISASVTAWYTWRVTGGLESFWLALWPKGWAFAASPFVVKWEMPLFWKEWLLLPFLRTEHSLAGYLLDPRLAGGVIGALILIAKRFFGAPSERLREELVWCLFFVGAYVCWLVGFRDEFSSVILEVVSMLLLGRVLLWVAGARWGVLCLALWMFVFPPSFSASRQAPEGVNFSFFNEAVLTENPLVLLGGHLSGVAPFLPQQARFVGGIWFDPADYDPSKQFFLHRLNPLPKGYYSHRFDDKIRAAVRGHSGDIYALFDNEEPSSENTVWRRYGVELAEPVEKCQTLYSGMDIWPKGLLLCRMKKTAEK